MAPSSTQTEGPFSLRESDVKFRTNECTSMWHVWREGMAEWKRAFEVPEVKQVIMESRGEVLDEVVQEYLAKNMAKAGKGKSDTDGKKRDGDFEVRTRKAFGISLS